MIDSDDFREDSKEDADNANVPESQALIQRRFSPVQTSSTDQRRKAFSRGLRWIWYKLKGYAINDIDRLHEAGIVAVEAKAHATVYENLKKEAEAAKIFAETEEIKQRTAANYQLTESKNRDVLIKQQEQFVDLQERSAEAERAKVEAAKTHTSELEKQAQAWERVLSAITEIKTQGGDVFFSGRQLESRITQLGDTLSNPLDNDPEDSQES